MTTDNHIPGIHHITAITSSAAENLIFYESVLGLRLVKQTVNFDDPYTYHLYYGDTAGSPGTIMTFFPWEELPRGRTGAGMVVSVAFSIPAGSVDYWRRHLGASGIEVREAVRFGDLVLRFSDPHGLALELIETAGDHPALARKDQLGSDSHPIAGFHSATALLRSLDGTRELLTDVMGMTYCGKDGDRHRFKMKPDLSPGSVYDVVLDPQAESGRQGSGTVHHIAFRTLTDDGQKSWQASLRDGGYEVTPVRDRKYFRSVYFHEPGGVLFEIATDPPGFAVDEPADALGESLQLPKHLEARRADIERRLPALRPLEHRNVS